MLSSAAAVSVACTTGNDTTDVLALTPAKTVLDLVDVKSNPENYEWFDFRPNVKKLILSGAAETEHVAILWYTVVDGSVGLHLHSKTESVYVIDGTQTDAKGVYPTGTVYFNPPGSGHAISDSS
ncbi:MAG TPA: cupin domain-containing protein, partial [Polyangiaceae bacterium]|nr:cupin domain-containing protein [Polyangiaceae bacterium]